MVLVKSIRIVMKLANTLEVLDLNILDHGAMTFAPKSTRHLFNTDTIRFPTLTSAEVYRGYNLIMDSGVGTCCAGNHVWVVDFIQGLTLSCRGFSGFLPI